MAKASKPKTSKKDIEKRLRKNIQQKLTIALSDHRNGMNENDFQNSLKKASKLISKDLVGAETKRLKREEKENKKATKKKNEFLM